MTSAITSIPDEYLCPITRELMINPVILIEDGYSYEESFIQSWLQNHNRSPMTNNELTNRTYVPNRALKSLINDFISQKQILSHSLTEEFLSFKICTKPIISDWKNRPKIRIRLTLLGSSAIGKTVLAQCLKYGRWPQTMTLPTSTIGSDILFYYLDKLFRNEYVVAIQLNDPPGQEQFESVTNHFFRECHGALLLADTTRLETLDRLEKFWYPKLEKFGMDHFQSVLVCTKMDLFEKEDIKYRELFLQRSQQFAFAHQMPIVNISAYRGDNIEYLFKQLIIRIMENDILINDLINQAISSQKLNIIQQQVIPVIHISEKQKSKFTCCN
ncbi:unnamed protein product [Adineta steineri]|uniref:U-box domain-containing protein n=1 Tax=Adineta steineri TaxID=433720 RepID=A0A814QYS9_9BILA|nr:unnamed protein product [Adineta steineri]